MKLAKKLPSPILAYIQKQPLCAKKHLKQMHQLVKKTAPKATECIAWGMPAIKGNKYIVFFAAHKNHLGFYPMPFALRTFKRELSEYKVTKGGVQFPYDRKLPIAVIKKMIRLRLKQDAGANK